MSKAIHLLRHGRVGLSAIRDRFRILSQTQGLFLESSGAATPSLQSEKKEALRGIFWSPLAHHSGADVKFGQVHQPVRFCVRELSSSSVWRAASDSRGAVSEETKAEETKAAAGATGEGQEPAVSADEKPAVPVEELKKAIADLEVKNQESEEAVKDLKDKLLRTFADMENLRERTQRELENLRKYANQEFAKDLLPVADILSLAQASVPGSFRTEGSEVDSAAASKMLVSLLKGVEMTEKELMRVFKKHGVERDDPTGKSFDPNIHMAQFEVADDTKEPGTIHTVTKVGYTLHGRVIRPAEVGIVRDPSE